MDFSNALTNTYTLVFFVLLCVSLVVLSLYYGLTLLRVATHKGKNLPDSSALSVSDLPPVSVVLVAHNESEFLKESLPYLLEQDYPNFEVVVVDYTSRDDTQFVLQVCSENYPNLKAISFPEDVNMFKGKKYPLSIGIKSAKNDVILLTEPGCVPKDFGWIREMVCGYMHGASAVLGYSLLKDGKGLLALLQQYENMMFGASYLGMALLGNPYTATGRNLSFRRDFFFSHGGFISHYSISEGADDLFVNQNVTRSNSTVVLHEKAAVEADVNSTFSLWHEDRRARFVTRHLYGLKDKLILLAYPLSLVIFILVLVLLWVGGLFPWQLLAAVLGLKIVWQVICTALYGKRFKIKVVQFLSPIFEIYFLFANTILYLFTLRRK